MQKNTVTTHTRTHTCTWSHLCWTAFMFNFFSPSVLCNFFTVFPKIQMWKVTPSNLTPQSTVMSCYSFASTRIITSQQSTIWNVQTFKQVKLYRSVWRLLCAPAFYSQRWKVLRRLHNASQGGRRLYEVKANQWWTANALCKYWFADDRVQFAQYSTASLVNFLHCKHRLNNIETVFDCL